MARHVTRDSGGRTLALLLLVVGTGCKDPVPDLPPASSPAKTRAALAEELPEGKLEAFGIQLPARSSVKTRTPSSMTVDVPTDVDMTVSYLKERLATFTTEKRKGQVVFLDAVPKSAPDRRLRITLKGTSLTTEVAFLVLPKAGVAPPSGTPDENSISDDDPPGAPGSAAPEAPAD